MSGLDIVTRGLVKSRRELVVNGGFDVDAVWAKGAGWTILGGVALGTANTYLTQACLTPGTLYSISVNILAITGQFRFACGSVTYSQYYATTGLKTEILRCAGNTLLYLFPEAASTCTIDDVSVKATPG
jgi:hypothetical protein